MIPSLIEETELFPAYPEDLGPVDARGGFWPLLRQTHKEKEYALFMKWA
jgi:hypothetical protein